MSRQPVGMDELVEHWTVLEDELELVAGKRGPTRLGFALLLKYYTRHGRFPRGRAEFADEVVGYVARQVKVPASELGLYDWTGRTIEYHRAQIRDHLGFRVCGVVDAEKLTQWLVAEVAHAERHPDRVRGGAAAALPQGAYRAAGAGLRQYPHAPRRAGRTRLERPAHPTRPPRPHPAVLGPRTPLR